MASLPLVAVPAAAVRHRRVGQKETGPEGARSPQYSFAESKMIFPGTVRDYWVYVPAQYDASKPACVWVGNQDGTSRTMRPRSS